MILYHPTGTAFLLSPDLWQSALALARSFGWQPAGTLPPPVPLDRASFPWHAGYEHPAGQQVSRPDACAFASALDRACAGQPSLSPALRQLAHFCHEGGFLVCPSPDLDSLVSLAQQTAATGAVPAPLPHTQAHPAKPSAA